MKAKTVDELKRLIEENPYEYASLFLEDDSFAFYCYSNNSYVDLCEKFESGNVDKAECERFKITEDEWKAGVEMGMLAHYWEM
jgi:hypothetical protein